MVLSQNFNLNIEKRKSGNIKYDQFNTMAV